MKKPGGGMGMFRGGMPPIASGGGMAPGGKFGGNIGGMGMLRFGGPPGSPGGGIMGGPRCPGGGGPCIQFGGIWSRPGGGGRWCMCDGLRGSWSGERTGSSMLNPGGGAGRPPSGDFWVCCCREIMFCSWSPRCASGPARMRFMRNSVLLLFLAAGGASRWFEVWLDAR